MTTVFNGLKKTVNDFFEDFKIFLKETFRLFKENFHEVFIFTLLCAFFSIIGTIVLKDLTLNMVLISNDITYIAPTNLLGALLSKKTIFYLIVFLVLIALMAIFEIGGLLHAFSMSQIGRDTSLVSMCAAGFRTCLKALDPQNWLIVLFLIVLFPLAKVLPLSSSVFKVIIPGFIYQTIEYTSLYNQIYKVFYFLLICFLVVFVFSINIFVMQNCSFNKACSRSFKLQKGKYFHTFLTLLLLTVIMNFLINSIASIVVINFREIYSFFVKSSGIVTKSSDVGTYTYALRQVLKSLLLPAVNNAALTVLYYKYMEEKHLFTSISRDVFKEVNTNRKILVVVSMICLLISTVAAFRLNKDFSFLAEPVSRPLVCAHRGDNYNAPENTMPAFELANMENLLWIELDVHQTKDGVIVVNHDSDISRTTGQNLSIHDSTLAQLQSYEYGDWMPGNYTGVKMPTLEEVLRFAHDAFLYVQVELKGHYDDKNFEENVLKVINDTGMHDMVMVIAQDYSRLERINELDPTILKGYCMVLAFGKLDDIECTDNVTIEESNVTPELVHDLHSRGVKVFCWTVDSEDTIQYLVSCDVDVIGTDNPTMVSAALERVSYEGGLPRITNIVMNYIGNMDK